MTEPTALVQTLRDRIAETDGLSNDDQAALNALCTALETAILDVEHDAETRGLAAIKHGIENAEIEHPRATAILNDILMQLSAMGI